MRSTRPARPDVASYLRAMEWKERSGVRWLEAELPGATAAFSTRIGGTSSGAFASLNVGILTDDDPGNVIANRERLALALGAEPGKVLMGHQVHGAELARHEEPQQPSPFAEGVPASEQVDAQVTTTPELVPLVQVADCLPIALAGNRGVAIFTKLLTLTFTPRILIGPLLESNLPGAR